MREREEAANPNLQRLSFLYATYEPQCWWFERFDKLRRLVLKAGVSFFKPGTAVQIIFSIILSLGTA